MSEKKLDIESIKEALKLEMRDDVKSDRLYRIPYIGTMEIKLLNVDVFLKINKKTARIIIRPLENDFSDEIVQEISSVAWKYYSINRELLQIRKDRVVSMLHNAEINLRTYKEDTISFLINLKASLKDSKCTIHQRIKYCKCKSCHFNLIKSAEKKFIFHGMSKKEVDSLFEHCKLRIE